MEKAVIIALDFPNKEETFRFIETFDTPLYVKVGMELYYKEGRQVIEALKAKGHKIFLDLKLNDIPTTVYKTMRNLASFEVDMVTVHASGGKEMMQQAVLGLKEGSKGERPLCVAVTMLTSLSQQVVHDELWIPHSIDDIVLHYAKNAQDAGLDGIVCSPLESKMIHEKLGEAFQTVTPGIRLESDAKNDQKRAATPLLARALTSDFIVVGRSITQANNPVHAYQTIHKQFVEGVER